MGGIVVTQKPKERKNSEGVKLSFTDKYQHHI